MARKEHDSPGSLSGMDTELLHNSPRFSETNSYLDQLLSGIEVGFRLRLGR